MTEQNMTEEKIIQHGMISGDVNDDTMESNRVEYHGPYHHIVVYATATVSLSLALSHHPRHRFNQPCFQGLSLPLLHLQLALQLHQLRLAVRLQLGDLRAVTLKLEVYQSSGDNRLGGIWKLRAIQLALRIQGASKS